MSDGPKTIDDLLALEASTGERFEIVNGEFISMDNPPRHSPGSTQVSATIARFGYFLVEYAESHPEFEVFDGNLEFALPGGTRRAAVSAMRRGDDAGVDRDHISGAPNLVVEVINPADLIVEKQRKIRDWLDSGAKMVWVAMPVWNEVYIYRRGRNMRAVCEGQVLDGEDVLPGFAVEVSRLFPSRAECPAD